MKPANASAMRSTRDQVSVHRHIQSPDELTLSFRLSQSECPGTLVTQHAIRTSRGDVAPCASQAVSPAQFRTRWPRPAASNSGGNVPAKVILSNYAPAINMLGRCWELGWGLPVDLQRAADCYQRAAEAGL